NWNVEQIVDVTAAPLAGTGIVGIHYARVTTTVDNTTTNENNYIGTTPLDIAAGLANAVAGDPTGRFQTTSSGNASSAQLTITGPAFPFVSPQPHHGLEIDTADSTPAFTGEVTATIGSTGVGDTWTLTVDGARFGYLVQTGNTPADVASALVSIINQSGT